MLSLCKSWTVETSAHIAPWRPCGPTHETREPLKRPWYPYTRINLNELAFGGMYVDLQQACLVQGRVEQGEQALRSFSGDS